MTCTNCGVDVAEGARFCWSCGQSLTTTSDERRVVTVLFADLVGFTSMSETLDPEQVKRFVDRAFERLVADVVAFGGRVDKIIGDAIVALFGAPTAHEDDAERAVRAALRMQQTLATYASETRMSVRMRIGVNSGEVLVGALRAGGDYTTMGDVVNTASRLQTSADPGAVLVGESTYATTHEVIVYESCGALVARGRGQPVNVWVAKDALLPPGYRPRRTRSPLVGRESELSILENAVSLSIRHERSQLVLLMGDAGVGKSRLASEIAPVVRSQWPDAIVLNGRCVPYGEANPWWPIADALRNGIGLSLAEPIDRARAETLAVVERVLGGGDPRRESVVNGILHLMGYEGPLRDLEPSRARVEATGALMVAMEAWVRQQPVVVRLADLHWADDIVLELIDELTTHLARSSFVLVCTTRRSLLRRWSPRAGRNNTLVLNLDPLDRSASDALIDSLVPVQLPGHVRDMLLDRSGGNPLYLEELITLVGDGEQVSLATDLELPDTLRGLIAARIDGLTPEEQHTLEDAAVWGANGPLEALERLGQATRDAEDVPAVVDRLEAKEVLTFDGTTWAFRSDLVREVAYARLTKLDRYRRHKGIAAYLDGAVGGQFVDDAFVDIVARHVGEAARLAIELGADAGAHDDLTEQALHWLAEAARRAERAAAWPLAERLHDQALELAAGSDAELDHLLGRAVARKELWKFDDARDDAARAWSIAERDGEPAKVGGALLVLGEVEARGGAPDVANRILLDAIQRFDELGDVKGRAEARRLIGMAAVFQQDYAAAEGPATGALADFRAIGDRRGEAWALQNLAWISFATGRAADAEARLTDAAEAFASLGDIGGKSWTDGLLAFIRFFQGRSDEAHDLASGALRESERRADRWGQGMMLLVISSVELWRGHTVRAEELAQRSVALLRALHDSVGIGLSIALRSRSLLMLGRIAEARASIDELVDENTPGTAVAPLLGLVASVLVGDVERLTAGVEAFETPVGGPFGANPAESDVFLALAQLQLGCDEEADRLVEKALAADPGSPFAHSAGAFVAAARGDVAEVVARVEQVEAARRATYLDRAYAHIAASLVGDEVPPELDAVLAPTDDVLAKALAALAAAHVLRPRGDDAARAASTDAARRWAEIGFDPQGWRRLFARITDPNGSRPDHLVG